MRLLAIGTALAFAGILTACDKNEDAMAGPHRGGGRFFGIGIYPADELWSRQAGVKPNADSAKATLADDAQVIVVVDSRTGEVRQCGNQSGHCISMNPWAGQLGPTQVAPVSLSKHAADLQIETEGTSEPATSNPINAN